MIEQFDSRALTYTDCYARRFGTPGSVRFRVVSSVLPAAGVPSAPGVQSLGEFFDDAEDGFEVAEPEVGAGLETRQADQHHVEVRLRARRMGPLALPESVHSGDLLSWAAATPDTPLFVVRGIDAVESFSSAGLTSGSLYSHPFGHPGTHRWSDAIGGQIGGEVIVTEPATDTPDELAAWTVALRDATVVTIDDGRVEPDRVEIVTGQTVIWAVVEAEPPGVTITSSAIAMEGGRP